MAKLQINHNMLMPISKTMHDLMLACGYSLSKQDTLLLVYRKGENRVTFRLSFVEYEVLFPPEEDRLEAWSTMLSMVIGFMISDGNLAMILQSCGAIDFTKVPEFLESFKKIANDDNGQTAMAVNNPVISRGNSIGYTGLPQGTSMGTTGTA